MGTQPVDTSKGDLKKQNCICHQTVGFYVSLSVNGEYKAVLSLYNIYVEELKGEVKGKPYRGLMYSTMDNEEIKSAIH
jgi:hypothetical protein